MDAETFVGLDVHKDVVVATAVDRLGRRIDRAELGGSGDEVVRFLEALPGAKKVALEACSVWEHLYDAVSSTGASVVLSHPYRTRLIADASLKSDKVDSEALATLLRLDALPTAFAPTEAGRALRRMTRDRLFYRRLEKSVRNHLYGQLLAKGVPYDTGVLSRKRKREELRGRVNPEFDRGLDSLRDMEARTLELNRAIHRAFSGSKEAQLLETIPGIGEITALALVAFLCPIERFSSFDRLSSYVGLCPTNHQSSGTSYQGGLKSDCNTILRGLLVEAAWIHRQRVRNGYVARVGRRISRRKGQKRGSVSAAHALLRVVFAILKRGTPYSPEAPERPSCSTVTARSPR